MIKPVFRTHGSPKMGWGIVTHYFLRNDWYTHEIYSIDDPFEEEFPIKLIYVGCRYFTNDFRWEIHKLAKKW